MGYDGWVEGNIYNQHPNQWVGKIPIYCRPTNL